MITVLSVVLMLALGQDHLGAGGEINTGEQL